jgi:hypothetical protein
MPWAQCGGTEIEAAVSAPSDLRKEGRPVRVELGTTSAKRFDSRVALVSDGSLPEIEQQTRIEARNLRQAVPIYPGSDEER